METIGTIISTLTVLGIVAVLALGRKIVGLPKEMMIVKAALFRLLRSNKIQGVALSAIAECQKEGTCNGKTEIAIEAVQIDQQKIDSFLAKAALGKPEALEEVE